MKNQYFSQTNLTALCIAAALLTSGKGHAQIEEITVTATKRGEVDIQDIAASISAFGAKKIDRLNALEFAEFARHVPSLMFVSDGGPGLGNQQISLRGLNPIADGFNTVAEYMDGAPRFGNTNRLFDMQQVEVLRGPQGTLYGSNSQGGTIRYLTNPPDAKKFGAAASFDIADTDGADGNTSTFEGMLNVPVIEDELAVRAAVLYLDEAGYINNITTGEDGVNKGETQSARVSVKWTPNDKFDVRATYYYDDLDYKSSTAFMPTLEPFFSRDSFFDEPAFQKYDIYNLSWNYDFGWALLSATSVRYENEGSITFDLNTELAPDGLPLSNEVNHFTQESTTHEFRLVSQSDSPFQWIVGYYYDEFEEDISTVLNGFPNPNLPNDPAPFTPDRVGLPPGESFSIAERITGLANTEENAFFGEISYAFNERWTVLLGARKFDFEQEDNTVLEDFFGDIGADTWNPDIIPQPDGANKDDDVFFKFNVQYRPNQTMLFYATVAEGFRPGGFNRNAGTLGIPLSASQYDPDKVTSHEIGANTSWLENRVIANLNVFFVDWSDVQTEIETSSARGYTINGGEAESKGLELSLTVQDLWINGLSIDFSWGYTDAEFTKDVFNDDGSVALLAGDVMPRVPSNTYSLDLGYDWTLSNGLSAYVRGNYAHSDDALDGLRPPDPALVEAGEVRPVFVASNQDIINLSAGVNSEHWGFRLYVNNATNQTPFSFIQASAGFSEPTLVGTYTPRTVGLKIDYSY